VAAGAVLAGVGAIAAKAYEAASSLEQSTGAVESVFGAQAGAVQDYAAQAAQAAGLSQDAYQTLSATLGSQLKSMGYAGGELVEQNNDLIQTGADLAATFGGSTSDAVSALSSLMRGERDPIERYGIAITQAAVDAKVAALGLDTSTDAAKRASQAQATLALVAEQSADAQGAFAREADTAAGQTERAKAEWENASAALGEVLLPIVSAAAQKLAGLASWLVQNKDVVLPLIGVVAGLAAGILALNAGMGAYKTVQTAVNGVLNASPLMRLVAIIGLIIGVVVTMYQKFDWFRDIVDSVGNALKWAFEAAQGVIQWVLDKINWVLDKLSWIGDAASWVGDLFSASGTVTVTPVAGGSVAGLFGATAGVAAAAAPVHGAPMAALAGGRSTAGQGPASMVVNVRIDGALDPVAVGRQLEKVLRDYGRATGRQVALTMGRA
jgi:hypothetical protein